MTQIKKGKKKRNVAKIPSAPASSMDASRADTLAKRSEPSSNQAAPSLTPFSAPPQLPYSSATYAATHASAVPIPGPSAPIWSPHRRFRFKSTLLPPLRLNHQHCPMIRTFQRLRSGCHQALLPVWSLQRNQGLVGFFKIFNLSRLHMVPTHGSLTHRQIPSI